MISVLPIIVERPLGIFLLGACWMFIRANSLATLPVEMNATFRVSSLIRGQRLLSAGREWKQLTEMMGAAELDKVSGFLKTAHFLVTRIVFWRRR
jgi:Zn-dependent membrane protease YugP